MALRFPSSTSLLDLDPCDSPTAAPTSQHGGSGNEARAGVARKTKEVEHMLANLEKEGVKIDGKIASIIDDEVARIKAEAARKNINELKRKKLKKNGIMVVLSLVSVAFGFSMGVDWYVDALYAKVAKIIVFGEK
ncbi:unnamed protein product [Urochloa decumbens]|uniref:Uncharacterized protein n=1 Tax=Urochloa decumbens TaxID=240449 RepID=A0ABC9FMU9_9POAL